MLRKARTPHDEPQVRSTLIQSFIKKRIALESKRNVDALLHWDDKRQGGPRVAEGIDALADSPVSGTSQLTDCDRELRRAVSELADATVDIDPARMMDMLPEFYVYMMRVKRGIRRAERSLCENRGLERVEVDPEFIADLEKTARDLGISRLGYCEVPRHLIFRGRQVAYPHAIVCMQEMKRSEIETAPADPAGMEAMRVYANLGVAMNSLADWIRERGIAAAVSHPLGGSTLYTALGAEAGLGYRGRSGLLITPEFGTRQRLGIITTPAEGLPFQGGNQHEWVLDFCDSCNKCVRACPAGAIRDDVARNGRGVFTSIDFKRCYPYFAITAGCSVCVKVCPFSRGSYAGIKERFAGERG